MIIEVIIRARGKDSWEITKLQAAATQLSTAIRVLLLRNDPISAHVLASSALEVIDTLLRAKGHEPLHDIVLKHVKEEAVPAFRRLLREDYNFFKHADRDHDAKNDV